MGVPESHRGRGSVVLNEGRRAAEVAESAEQTLDVRRSLTVIPAVHLEKIDVIRLEAREAGVYAERMEG